MAEGSGMPPISPLYPTAVYIDPINGIRLADSPLPSIAGTPGTPVNNLADAVAIAATRRTNVLHIKNSLTIDRDLANFVIIGDGDFGVTTVSLAGKNLSGCNISGLHLTGAGAGNWIAKECLIDNVTAQNGQAQIHDSAVLTLLVAGNMYLTKCYAAVRFPLSQSTFTVYSGTLQNVGWMGGRIYLIASAGASVYVDAVECDLLEIDAASGAGVILLGGNIRQIKNDAGVANCPIFDYTALPGRNMTAEFSIASAANAGDVNVASLQTISAILPNGKTPSYARIKSIVLRSNGVTTVNLTSIGIYAGQTKVLTLIDPSIGTQANLNASDKQVQAVGPWDVRGNAIVATLTGTGATAVDLVLSIEYEPLEPGSYFA